MIDIFNINRMSDSNLLLFTKNVKKMEFSYKGQFYKNFNISKYSCVFNGNENSNN